MKVGMQVHCGSVGIDVYFPDDYGSMSGCISPKVISIY